MDYSHKIIPPRYDVVFKAIFGREENKPLIISLLSSILTINIDELDELIFMNGELTSDYIDGKGTRLDLRLYEDPSIHSVFKIYEEKHHLLFSDHLEIHMIELPKIEGYNKGIENPLLIDWMAFLNVRSESDMVELKSKENLPQEILAALDELEKLSQDPNMRMEALNKEMWIRDQMVLINMAKNAEIDGYTRGRVETLEATAKNMKALGLSLEIITKTTGLDAETIEKL